MRTPTIPDDQLEQEIARLKQSKYVKLASKEQSLKVDKRRKALAQLRWQEKRGRQLAEMGITLENMETMLFQDGDGDE